MRIPFTSQNAAEMARKSAESRRKRREAKLAARHIQAPAEVIAKVQEEIATEKDDFATQRLLRVRDQLGKLDNRMDDALDAKRIDPQTIERLARASCQLSEAERVLAGRPLPGSHRPKSAGTSKRGQVAEPID